MAKYCPDSASNVVYMECLECTNRMCKKDYFYCVVFGNNDYNDYEEFAKIMDAALKNKRAGHKLIVNGLSGEGTDALVQRYAKDRAIDIKTFDDEWNENNPAGLKRNNAMIRYAARCTDSRNRGVIVFWDMKAKGIASSIKLAKERSSQLRVYDIANHCLAKGEKYQ